MSAKGLITEITEESVANEVEAQTGERPVRCIISRQTTINDPETIWLVSFTKKVGPFQLFGHSWTSRHIRRVPRVQQCTGCFRFHGNSLRCEKKTCLQCAQPQHEGSCRDTTPKCINCNGPHPADDTKCPARPKVVLGVIRRPSQEQLHVIRLAGGRARSRALNEARKQTQTTATEAGQTNGKPIESAATEAAQTSYEPADAEDLMQVEEQVPSGARQVNTIVVC